MHFYTPTSTILTSLTLLNTLPLLTTAQLSPSETICEFLYGTSYTDACCHTVISRGPNAPCTDMEHVSNLTECSTERYPTGSAVCVQKSYLPDSSSGPLFGHAPSGIAHEWTTLQDPVDVYNLYFSSNAMGESMVAAVVKAGL